MPDCPESTLTVPEAQQRLAEIVEELRQLDQRLCAVAAGDLLRDAIETLSGLAAMTEDAAVRRRLAVADAVERLAAAA